MTYWAASHKLNKQGRKPGGGGFSLSRKLGGPRPYIRLAAPRCPWPPSLSDPHPASSARRLRGAAGRPRPSLVAKPLSGAGRGAQSRVDDVSDEGSQPRRAREGRGWGRGHFANGSPSSEIAHPGGCPPWSLHGDEHAGTGQKREHRQEWRQAPGASHARPAPSHGFREHVWAVNLRPRRHPRGFRPRAQLHSGLATRDGRGELRTHPALCR